MNALFRDLLAEPLCGGRAAAQTSNRQKPNQNRLSEEPATSFHGCFSLYDYAQSGNINVLHVARTRYRYRSRSAILPVARR